MKKEAKEVKELKIFNMRMPKDMWMFLKKTAAHQEMSMTEIILYCVEKYKKRFASKLTDDDTNV